MHDPLDDDLTTWGQSNTPPVDGAFANRLEASLRSDMIAGSAPSQRRWFEWVFRPGVVVLAVAALLFGFAFVAGSTDDADLADGAGPTMPAPTTVPGDPRTTTTTGPDEVNDAPPLTGTMMTTSPVAPSSSDQPDEPAPETTAPAPLPDDATTAAPTDETTIPDDVTTTIPPIAPLELVLRLDGRQVNASWTFGRADAASISGWVLLATADGAGQRDGEIVASSRDVSIRQLTATVTDLSTTYRIEGRSADGTVIASSDDVQLSRDG